MGKQIMGDYDGNDLAIEFAIYDGGNANSKNNKLVEMIEQNANLTEEEKENLLKAHEVRLGYIDNMMTGEKKR